MPCLSSRAVFLRSTSAFTLIELLVVIAVIAVLSVIVILAINPVELLRQSRDSNRISDLNTVNTALSIYNTDQPSGYMGVATKVYISIPDATTTCANLGLPALPGGYSYNCSTSQNYRKVDGTGWIPVDFTAVSFRTPISSLPVDPVNTTSTNFYYTYVPGGSWKLSALSLESQRYSGKTSSDGGVAQSSYEVGNDLTLGSGIFPSGWVKVPGNNAFGTSDFWVMKYEAKCALASSNTSLTSPATANNTYDNSATPCTGSAYHLASTPDGYPVANISQTTAESYCVAIGGHLITNNQWQTIAWNMQNVPSNWTNGSVGSGAVYSGHNDNVPANGLAASIDDTNGYFGTGQSSPSTQKRTLTLSNGSVVWDMAGNTWEWTNNTITGANGPYAAPAGLNWREFPNITNWGTMTQQTAGPVNSAWNYTNGIGRIYSDGSAGNSTVYGFLRGGAWSSTAYAGIEALYLKYGPTFASDGISFRCAR